MFITLNPYLPYSKTVFNLFEYAICVHWSHKPHKLNQPHEQYWHEWFRVNWQKPTNKDELKNTHIIKQQSLSVYHTKLFGIEID